MNGVLVIDKPAGPTSHDVVARVRTVTGCRRIGHTGTLDPFATGVLPLVVGRATRLARFLTAGEKEYDAFIRLGLATDTYDATGRPLEPSGSARMDLSSIRSLSHHELEAALAAFTGTVWQAPPPFSAKKIQGVRAHRLARRLAPVQPSPVQVTVGELRLLSREDDVLGVHIRCSQGFYVRSFAHDLGVRLGTGGHVIALRRTRVGEFTLAAAIPLDHIERSGAGSLDRLIPMAQLLPRWPAAVLTEEGAQRVVHGHAVGPREMIVTPAADGQRVKLLDREGSLLAIGERTGGPGALHPSVVLV